MNYLLSAPPFRLQNSNDAITPNGTLLVVLFDVAIGLGIRATLANDYSSGSLWNAPTHMRANVSLKDGRGKRHCDAGIW